MAELKLEKINESLWDAFKLIWLAEALHTGPQYVACAAHERVWPHPGQPETGPDGTISGVPSISRHRSPRTPPLSLGRSSRRS